MATALVLLIIMAIMLVIVAAVLAVVLYFVPNVFWRQMPERRASSGSMFVQTPVEFTDSSVSQMVRGTRVSLPFSAIVRVDFLRSPENHRVRNGHWEFWVVRVQDVGGAAVFVERVRIWWGKPLRLNLAPPSNGADWTDVRGIVRALLPRLPAAAVVDPQVLAYALIGQYPKR